MLVDTNYHIFFYLFIAATAGMGLFFSQKTDGDVGQYFFAGNSKNGSLLGISLFLVILFNLVLLILPGIGIQGFSSSLSAVAVFSVIASVFVGRKLFDSIKIFFSMFGKTGSVLLGLHGLLFLAVFQILILLQISDFIIQMYFGESQFSLLVVMIIASGVYVLVGGLNAVYYSNVLIGFFFIGSIVLLAANTLFVQNPLFFSFHNAFSTGSAVFRDAGISEPNIAITGITIFIMTFWLIWMELGGIQRKVSVPNAKSLHEGLLIAGILLIVALAGIFYDALQGRAFLGQNIAPESGVTDGFVVIGFLMGLTGMFAMTFQSIGSIVALRLFAPFRKEKNEAEQVLVGRLTTVVTVLLSISMISFAKISGTKTLIWFIEFLIFFSTPIVASFFVFAAGKKNNFFPIAVIILAGELYAMVEYISQKISMHPSFFNVTSIYSFAFEMVVGTAVTGIVLLKVSEIRAVRQLFSKIHFTQIDR